MFVTGLFQNIRTKALVFDFIFVLVYEQAVTKSSKVLISQASNIIKREYVFLSTKAHHYMYRKLGL